MGAPNGDRLRTSESLPSSGVLLAIDWGARRIGLAASDPTQTVAHPLGVITRRTGRRFPLSRLKPYLDTHSPVGIVLGLPLAPDGSVGAATEAAYALADTIATRIHLPIAYWDERLTTARTRRAMRETGTRPGDHRDRLDALAAVVLLQHFLDVRAK